MSDHPGDDRGQHDNDRVTLTGASGTSAVSVAESIGAGLEVLWRFDAITWTWRTYLPGAREAVNTLAELEPRHGIFVQLAAVASIDWTVTALVPDASGQRSLVLALGLNFLGCTGPRGTLSPRVAGGGDRRHPAGLAVQRRSAALAGLLPRRARLGQRLQH